MKLHHFGIAVENGARAALLLVDVAGYIRTVELHDEERQARIWLLTPEGGGPLLELLQPLSPSSPAAAMLRRDIAAYHICYEVAGLDAEIAEWQQVGAKLVDGPKAAPAFKDRRVAFLFMPATKQLIELLEE